MIRKRNISNTQKGRKLRVLIISPIVIPLNKDITYGGIERVILSLTAKLGDKVNYVVAASKDSKIRNLIHSNQNSLWKMKANNMKIVSFNAANEKHFKMCLAYADKNKIDVIHDNAELVNSKIYKNSKLDIPVVMTLHGDSAMQYWKRFELWSKMQKSRKLYFCSISNSQKKKFEEHTEIKIDSVIHNGIDVKSYPFKAKKQNYFFWIGRICSDKGTDLAIQISKRTKIPLIIAGNVHSINRKFYNKHVKPHITRFVEGSNEKETNAQRNQIIKSILHDEKIINPGEILYLGPVNDSQKKVLYSNAKACIALNRWDEPFGMFLPESMACGTPVIGTNLGSLPEIVVHGKTGFLVNVSKKKNNIAAEKHVVSAAARFAGQLSSIKPKDCRRHAERFFDNEKMAFEYSKLYKLVKEDGQTKNTG